MIGLETLTVVVTVDARLSKTSRWVLQGNTLQVRIPRHLTEKQVNQLLTDLVPRIARQRKRATRQSDIWLMNRASALNTQYFDGELSWHSIRWVGNMKRRLGSCTTGGATDGDIRISERIRRWPAYVVDYILAHEICHRKYPDHSPAFWEYLARYPFVEKALGFLEGISYAQGDDPQTLLD